MDNDLKKILVDAKILQPRRGDVLVFRMKDTLEIGPVVKQKMNEQLSELFDPMGVRCLIVPADFDVSLLKGNEDA